MPGIQTSRLRVRYATPHRPFRGPGYLRYIETRTRKSKEKREARHKHRYLGHKCQRKITWPYNRERWTLRCHFFRIALLLVVVGAKQSTRPKGACRLSFLLSSALAHMRTGGSKRGLEHWCSLFLDTENCSLRIILAIAMIASDRTCLACQTAGPRSPVAPADDKIKSYKEGLQKKKTRERGA